ncbi:MAG: hypothetical protein ACRETM_00970 [Stenotrophobium sp.]
MSQQECQMQHIKSFIAGFVSTLVFHQGLLALLHRAGVTPIAPYSMAATAPMHVPQVISLAFWGGIWGIVLWMLIANAKGSAFWLRAAVIGAIGPSVVAWFVVMPLKGMGMAGGWNPKVIVGALLLNAVWGLGVALIMRMLHRPDRD